MSKRKHCRSRDRETLHDKRLVNTADETEMSTGEAVFATLVTVGFYATAIGVRWECQRCGRVRR